MAADESTKREVFKKKKKEKMKERLLLTISGLLSLNSLIYSGCLGVALDA